MTADEIAYAGGKVFIKLSSPYAWYYLNSAGGSITGSTSWLTLSPFHWNGSYSHVWFAYGSGDPGSLYNGFVASSLAVRPAISLKSCTKWASGDGSSSNPYTIKETTTGC